MRNSRASRVGMVTLFGVLVLSIGLVRLVFMAGSAGSTPTQNWDTLLPADQRFTVLATLNNEAVRDNETGLVWEKIPAGGPTTWAIARGACLSKTEGGRKGWQLPSVHEMASLIDATQPIPTLPTGHPFTINLSSSYWSATLSADNSAAAWHVQFSNGLVSNLDRTADSFYVWCVRGHANADTY
jgi:hypothetical protein